jgi:hypothetical protein
MASARFSKWFITGLIGAAAFAMGAVPRDSAVIVNSGSTNTSGYRIEVWADGSASIAMVQQRFASPGPAKSFTVPAQTVKRFFDDLAAARKGNVVTEPCMKSASFGSTTKVTWQGWTSPDLSCPPKDSLGTALVTDVNDIQKASGVGAAPLHD